MAGLLGKKIGMTQIFDKDGKVVPVTVIEAGPCFVVQKKTVDSDGYDAVQMGFGLDKKATKPKKGHFAKASLKASPKYLREFRVQKADEFTPGQEIKVDVFKVGETLAITGTSIGKGFAGTVKRHHFNRGPMSHGSKSHRIPGSSGSGTTPGRVLKGKRRAGRLGGERVTIKSSVVVQVDPAKNLLLVRGAVPGPDSGLLLISHAG